jgi:hypothetical protein
MSALFGVEQCLPRPPSLDGLGMRAGRRGAPMSRTNVRFVALLAAMIEATLAAALCVNDVAIALATGAAVLIVLQAVASWRGEP